MRAPHSVPVLLAGLTLLLSCGGDNLVLPGTGEPASVTVIQGDDQNGRVGEALAEPLVVEVLDGADRPVVGATVAVELETGTAEPEALTTDAAGRASTVITLGSTVGATSGTFRVVAPEGPVEVTTGFTVTAVAASANGLAIVSGDDQTGAAGTELLLPLVVEVTDAFGNPIPNVPITWSAVGGGSLNRTETVTDAEGRTSVIRTLGPASGTQTTLASSEGLAGSPVTFIHTVTAGSPSGVQVISGNEQTAEPGTTLPDPIVVRVVDAGGNPVVGAAVTWVVTGGGGSLDPATGTTDDGGLASTSWTLGTAAGSNTAQAIVSGVGEATFTATASARTPDRIRIISGDEQAGQAGAALGAPLVVEVLDDTDTPVPDVTVNWEVEAGGGSVAPTSGTTDAAGRASASWTLGSSTGAQRVEASVSGAGSVRFTATATAGSPAVLGIRTQPSATAQVGVRLNRQPIIQVRDAGGNPVQVGGVTITAAIATGGGSLGGTTSATTGPNGRATFSNLEIHGATGTHTLIFAASGLQSVTSSAIAVSAASTTTRITSDTPDPSAPGQGVVVVFEVTSPGGTPAGTVQVTASGGNETCSAPVSTGQCTITLTSEGQRSLTATFAGSTTFQGSSGSTNHNVVTPDSPPVANNDGYSTSAGVTLSVPAPGVLANDSDPDNDPMTVQVITTTTRGTLTLQPDGSFEYVPSSTAVEDSFVYEVTAGGKTARATAVIIVN